MLTNISFIRVLIAIIRPFDFKFLYFKKSLQYILYIPIARMSIEDHNSSLKVKAALKQAFHLPASPEIQMLE